MMHLLTLNISLHNINFTFSQCKSTIPALPFENDLRTNHMIHQMRRSPFDLFDQLCNGYVRIQPDKHMYMVFYSPNR